MTPRGYLKRGAAVPWSPYRLSRSVLAAWWNADDHASSLLMTDDGSGLISSWKDCINGTNLTATTTARPTWGATAFNGRAGVAADGTANVLSLTGVPTTLPTGAAPGVLITVASSTESGSTSRNLFGYGVAVTGRAIRQVNNGMIAQGDAVTVGDGAGDRPAVGLHIFMTILTGSVLKGRMDGAPLVSAPPSLTPNTATTRVRMFSALGTSASAFWAGALRHALVLRGVPSDAILQQIEGWAAWNSGLQSILPDSHPYKASPP